MPSPRRGGSAVSIDTRSFTIRILLVEDDAELAHRLASGLAGASFIVERAHSGPDALAMGLSADYEVVILDLGLPEMEGLEVLRRWRAAGRAMPILILTARDSWTDKVDGLNAGADDYITKPFHIPEVVARLHALMRRKVGATSPVLAHQDIVLDLSSAKVTQAGKPVELTALEFRMLTYFLHRVGRLVTQAELNEHIYADGESKESNTIEVYVSRLRRKLGPGIVTTVRGLGYRMD